MKQVNFIKKICIATFMFFAGASFLFSEENSNIASQTVSSISKAGAAAVGGGVNSVPDAQLAMSRSDYPVTAGDVYTLAFAAGSTPISYSIPVDSTYKIRIANLGVINAKGLTYLQLKNQVTSIVQKNYPMGGVQFVLTAPATFTVTVTGEVKSTAERNAWALTRLSTFITQNFTLYSSLRKVTIISEEGSSKDYDLFKASRYGDLSQDPFLRPGDRIIVNRADRKVTVAGQVERPGTYELLEGENLKSLIGIYGDGLTKYADTTRIILSRNVNSKTPRGDTLYLDETAIETDFKLEDNDNVQISSRTEIAKTMFFEGAVGSIGQESQLEVGEMTKTDKEEKNPIINRIPVSFLEGENLATLIRRSRASFTPTSDLRNSYLARGKDRIPVNLENILYNNEFMSEYYAVEGDTLYVPYLQSVQTILVSGEVTTVAEVVAWPQKRLSTVISPYLTEYSSTRNIEVVSIDGVSTQYDLFRATRFGEVEQNPYVRAGESIKIKHMDRRVTISGAVKRPGTYELLEGENLKSLIDKYGDGLAPLGDITRMELFRQLTEGSDSGKKIYLSEQNYKDDYPLVCYDTVEISSFKDLMPVVFLEGAINIPDSQAKGTELESSNRLALSFNNGEDYAFFVRRNKSLFASVADLENAYIIRGKEHININLSNMLYDETFRSQIEMKLNDTLLVPFKQAFVSVSGAVYSPGRYPYIPDRTYDYYVGLAGGFIKEKNKLDAVTITDVEGNKHKKSEFILPEMNIDAKSNSGLYFFNQYAPVLTTVLSLISTSISLLVVSGAL